MAAVAVGWPVKDNEAHVSSRHRLRYHYLNTGNTCCHSGVTSVGPATRMFVRMAKLYSFCLPDNDSNATKSFR